MHAEHCCDVCVWGLKECAGRLASILGRGPGTGSWTFASVPYGRRQLRCPPYGKSQRGGFHEVSYGRLEGARVRISALEGPLEGHPNVFNLMMMLCQRRTRGRPQAGLLRTPREARTAGRRTARRTRQGLSMALGGQACLRLLPLRPIMPWQWRRIHLLDSPEAEQLRNPRPVRASFDRSAPVRRTASC